MVTIHSGNPFTSNCTSIPIMDQEIKISLSKKDLTYFLISVLLIMMGVGVGYRIGAYSKAHNSNFNHATASFAQFTTPDQLPPGSAQSTTIGESSLPTISDQSWDSKTPNTNNADPVTPTTSNTSEPVTYRYYSDSISGATITSTEINNSTPDTTSNKYIASKNGTKYYPINCKSADRIKAENRVYFASIEEAELEGLSAATTCK